MWKVYLKRPKLQMWLTDYEAFSLCVKIKSDFIHSAFGNLDLFILLVLEISWLLELSIV